MCPIEAYEGGTNYLGETGTGYSTIEKPGYKILWSGDLTGVATVTDGAGFSEQGILSLPGESMITKLPNNTEIVVYRK